MRFGSPSPSQNPTSVPTREEKDMKALRELSYEKLVSVRNNFETTLRDENHPHKDTVSATLALINAELKRRDENNIANRYADDKRK